MQVLRLHLWHAVRLECMRWAMHALKIAFWHARMQINMFSGILSIPRRRQIRSLQITWWSVCSTSLFDGLMCVVCTAALPYMLVTYFVWLFYKWVFIYIYIYSIRFLIIMKKKYIFTYWFCTLYLFQASLWTFLLGLSCNS